MTRKDYVLIADRLRSRRAHTAGYATAGFDHAVEAVADALAADNPRFDRARFLIAAGVA